MANVGVHLFVVIGFLSTVLCLPVPYEQPADAITLQKTGPNNPARTAIPDKGSKTKASGSKAKFGVLPAASTIEQPPVDRSQDLPWNTVVQDTEPVGEITDTEPAVEVVRPVDVENAEPEVEMDQQAFQNTAAVADVVTETETVDNASSVDETQSLSETVLVNGTETDVENGTATAPNVTETIDDFIDQLESLTNENQTNGLNVTADEFDSVNSTGVQVNATDPDGTYNATGIYMNSSNSSFGFLAEGIEINSSFDGNGTNSNATSAIGIGIIIVSADEGAIDSNSTSNSTSLGNSTAGGVNTSTANTPGYGFVMDNSAPDLNNTLIVNSTTVNATSAPGVNSTAQGVGFSVNSTSEIPTTTMAPIVNGTAIPIVNSTAGLVNATDVLTTTSQNATQTEVPGETTTTEILGEITTTEMPTAPAPTITDVPVI